MGYSSASSIPYTEHSRMAQQTLRALIWWFYRDLLAYKARAFEPPQGQAHGGLLEIQPAGGRSDALGARDLPENLEQVEIDTPKQKGVDLGLS